MTEPNNSTRRWFYPGESHFDLRAWWQRFSKPILIGAAIALIVGAIALVFVLSRSLYLVNLTVTGRTWQRTISVERFQTVHHSDEYASGVPGDAFNIRNFTVSHSAPEYCERTVGSGKHTTTESYFCGVRVWTDNMADYDVNRWVWYQDLNTSGDSTTDPVWAAFTPSGDGLGAVREGGRTETYVVHFTRADNGGMLDLKCSFTDWQSFKLQDRYTIQINRLEQEQWATLKPADPTKR